MKHHDVFADYTPWQGHLEAGWRCDFLGARTRESFWRKPGRPASPTGPRYEATDYPSADQNYLEWVDVLEAVRSAEGSFTMIELGAGYGRWLVRGAVAMRLTRGLPCRLVGVEAEPAHFEMMRVHFQDNGIDPACHTLHRAAVSARDGRVDFFVGHAEEWYGQGIAWSKSARLADYPAAAVTSVPAVSLATLLKPLDRVDLLDLDVQGAELDVLHAARAALDAKVKRVHIGTHGDAQEVGLRSLFQKLGWRPLNDYRHSAIQPTPFGEVRFGDGVQTWINDGLSGRSGRRRWWRFW